MFLLPTATLVQCLSPLSRCLTSRELLKHHQKCVNQSCPVCTPVKQYVQKQRMVMQKQQQETLARREAEARGYGNAHMMQVLLLLLPPFCADVCSCTLISCHVEIMMVHGPLGSWSCPVTTSVLRGLSAPRGVVMCSEGAPIL